MLCIALVRELLRVLLEGVSLLQAAMYRVYTLNQCLSRSHELASEGMSSTKAANNEVIVIWEQVNLANKYLFSLHCVLSTAVETGNVRVNSVP